MRMVVAVSQLRSYLEEHPQQSIPLDFNVDFINMLINLMLAQAQECFCEQVRTTLSTIYEKSN